MTLRLSSRWCCVDLAAYAAIVIRFDKKQISAAETTAFQLTRAVKFQEIDAAGIVFFARFFDFVHEAYEGFLQAAGQPLPQVLESRQWAAPIRHAEADYLAPLRFGDEFRVRLALAAVKEQEMSLGWCIEPLGGGRPFAVVQTVHSFLSLPGFQRVPVPLKIREALKECCEDF